MSSRPAGYKIVIGRGMSSVLEATQGGALNESTGLSFLLNPDLTSKEGHRINIDRLP